jgi:hypothetical protein
MMIGKMGRRIREIAVRFYDYFAISILLGLMVTAGLLMRSDEKLWERDFLPFVASVHLNAEINFNGREFVIVNHDAYDWTFVKLQVNTGLREGGYVLRTRKIRAGKTILLDSSRFANADGMPFDPRFIKPRNFSVWCDIPAGYGYWYREWEES